MRITIASSLLLAGCAASIQAARVPADLTPEMEKQARSLLSDRVRDPESLQLTKLEAARQSDGKIIVCGFYNAKNGFGGYAGRTPFFMIIHSPENAAIGWEPAGAAIIYAKCAANGLALT